MPHDSPNAPLPHSILASVIYTRGLFLIQWSGRIESSSRSSPLAHTAIRRCLAEIEDALQDYERAEFEAHKAKPALAIVKSEGAA